MKTPITIQTLEVCIPLSDAQAASLFSPAEIANLESRFDIETVGPWQIAKSVCGLAVDVDRFHGENGDFKTPQTWTLYGKRQMQACAPSGYSMDGRCSIAGKTRSCFTSSHLFSLPDGRLLKAAVLFLRSPKK